MTKATPVEDPVGRAPEHVDGELAAGDSEHADERDVDREHTERVGPEGAEALGAVGGTEARGAGFPEGGAHEAAPVAVSVVGGPGVPARRQRRVARRVARSASDAGSPGVSPGEPSGSSARARATSARSDASSSELEPATDAAGTVGADGAEEAEDIGGPGGTTVPEEIALGRERTERSATRGRRPAKRLVRRSTIVILSVSTALCAVAAVGFGLAWASLQGQQDTQAQVRAVARQFVLDLTNLTPKTVDAQIHDLLAASTGQFASQARSFFGGGIRQELEKAQPVEEGEVRALDVQSITGSRATVFAVVDDSYTNSALRASGQGRQTDVLRLDLGMVDTSRGWKIASVTVLGGPAGGVLGTPSAAHSPSIGSTGSSGSSS